MISFCPSLGQWTLDTQDMTVWKLRIIFLLLPHFFYLPPVYYYFLLHMSNLLNCQVRRPSPHRCKPEAAKGSLRRYLSLISPGERIVLTDGRVRCAYRPSLMSSQVRAEGWGRGVREIISQYCGDCLDLVKQRFELGDTGWTTVMY